MKHYEPRPAQRPARIEVRHYQRSLADLHAWHENIEAKLLHCHNQLTEMIHHTRDASLSAALLRDRVISLEMRRQQILREIDTFPGNGEATP